MPPPVVAVSAALKVKMAMSRNTARTAVAAVPVSASVPACVTVGILFPCHTLGCGSGHMDMEAVDSSIVADSGSVGGSC